MLYLGTKPIGGLFIGASGEPILDLTSLTTDVDLTSDTNAVITMNVSNNKLYRAPDNTIVTFTTNIPVYNGLVADLT